MHFQISTKIEQDYKSVFSKFDVNLLKRLKPIAVGLKILRYDGCEKGNEVHAEISFLGWKQRWNTLITEKTETNNEIYFIDEGLHTDMLPKPLKIWRHRHEISKFIDSSKLLIILHIVLKIFLLILCCFHLYICNFT
jgi:ligand-binding SRPBCC domain-containing protein